MTQINAADTAWVLVSASLVLLMTPALALFYGGMVRSKTVLNMMMMSAASMGLVGVLWVLYGYSMTFGKSWHGLVGNPLEFAGMRGVTELAVGPQGTRFPRWHSRASRRPSPSLPLRWSAAPSPTGCASPPGWPSAGCG
ncbi:hypothetical protein ACTQ49_05595 [Luteococcus sp. Sow4_B9]|uniref:hypothetical protein n=1 Tax=Luteococcus sp. Sow4_B9 TaxID=3438792 RepID=UPI003F9E96A2